MYRITSIDDCGRKVVLVKDFDAEAAERYASFLVGRPYVFTVVVEPLATSRT